MRTESPIPILDLTPVPVRLAKYSNQLLTHWKMWKEWMLKHTTKKTCGPHTLRLIKDEERAIQADQAINASFEYLDIESRHDLKSSEEGLEYTSSEEV